MFEYLNTGKPQSGVSRSGIGKPLPTSNNLQIGINFSDPCLKKLSEWGIPALLESFPQGFFRHAFRFSFWEIYESRNFLQNVRRSTSSMTGMLRDMAVEFRFYVTLNGIYAEALFKLSKTHTRVR